MKALEYLHTSIAFLPGNTRGEGRVSQSVKRLTTSWTFWVSNPGGARFSAHRVRPRAHLASCAMSTVSFPVRPGRAADHSKLLVPWS